MEFFFNPIFDPITWGLNEDQNRDADHDARERDRAHMSALTDFYFMSALT